MLLEFAEFVLGLDQITKNADGESLATNHDTVLGDNGIVFVIKFYLDIGGLFDHFVIVKPSPIRIIKLDFISPNINRKDNKRLNFFFERLNFFFEIIRPINSLADEFVCLDELFFECIFGI
jgi:hypothetical protein